MKYKIDEEFKKIIPSLTDKEFTQLEENCKKFGIQDSIKLWNGIVIDGHNRIVIAEKHNLQFDYENMKFKNRTEVIEWMLNNQLGRRNLNPDQLSIIRGKLYNLHKLSYGGDRKSKAQIGTLKNTAEEMAEKYKVSKNTIKRDAQFVESNPEIADKILKGETTKKQFKEEQKKKDLENKKAEIIAQTKNTIKKNRPKIYHESYETWFKKMKKCDLLLTDPPYSTDIDNIDEFVSKWLFKALSKIKKTGSAYIFIGAYPDEIKAYLNAKIPKHINLEQILIWEYKNTLGNNPKTRYKLNYQNILFYKGIENNYFDCPITNEQWAVHSVNAPDGRIGNRYHSWQKPLNLAERLIRHSTKENDIILDPFTCTGTFIIAANKLNRNGFGCDISKDNLKIAIDRGCELIE